MLYQILTVLLVAVLVFSIIKLMIRAQKKHKVEETYYDDKVYLTKSDVEDYIRWIADGHCGSYREFRNLRNTNAT